VLCLYAAESRSSPHRHADVVGGHRGAQVEDAAVGLHQHGPRAPGGAVVGRRVDEVKPVHGPLRDDRVQPARGVQGEPALNVVSRGQDPHGIGERHPVEAAHRHRVGLRAGEHEQPERAAGQRRESA
jgi:hypothetical protein